MDRESKQLDEVLDFILQDLGGDWILTGGTLVRLGFDSLRFTEDMDLARVGHPTLSRDATLERLFRWLIDRGLGPEWVNTAVEPFLKEVPDYERETVLFRQGGAGKIFRPNLTLFVYLKLRRGSEIDLSDIRVAIPKCSEGFDRDKFISWCDDRMRRRFERHVEALGL